MPACLIFNQCLELFEPVIGFTLGLKEVNPRLSRVVIVDEIVIDANMDKVPVLDLDAMTLLKMLKTLPMMMKALVVMLKPLWMIEKPLIG